MKRVGMLAGIVVLLLLIVFLATSDIQATENEALAVVIGVVCGVAAGIPTAVLLLVAVNRRDRQRAEEAERQALSQGARAGYWPTSVQRQWRVVGGDHLLLDDGGS